MMPPEREVLGILLPVGGGDPIPLLKTELILGRRPICDIRLDFNNVSGKHCVLQLISGTLAHSRPGIDQRNFRQWLAALQPARHHAR